jgi:hypothetical protein
MIETSYISGDPYYVSDELQTKLNAGWEIVDIATNLYESGAGIRKETTVYLKKTTV